MSEEQIIQRQEEGSKLYYPSKILALRKGTRKPKKHGSIMVFRSAYLEVRYDTFAPNLSVYYRGESVLYFHLGRIQRYKPDKWVNQLMNLATPVMMAQQLEDMTEKDKREKDRLAQWGLGP